MSRAPSVSVFVRRVSHGRFLATSYGHQALHHTSPDAAARACVARHLDMPESSIVLIPDSDNVFVGTLKEPVRAMQSSGRFAYRWDLLVIALAAILAPVLVLLLIAKVGAR